MNCQDTQDLLTQYLLGDLEPSQAEQVRAHLDGCDACRAAAKDIESTLSLLRAAAAAAPAAPARLDTAHRRRIAMSRVNWNLLTFPRFNWSHFAAAAAAALLILGTMAGLFMPALSMSRERARRSASAMRLGLDLTPLPRAQMELVEALPENAPVAGVMAGYDVKSESVFRDVNGTLPTAAPSPAETPFAEDAVMPMPPPAAPPAGAVLGTPTALSSLSMNEPKDRASLVTDGAAKTDVGDVVVTLGPANGDKRQSEFNWRGPDQPTSAGRGGSAGGKLGVDFELAADASKTKQITEAYKAPMVVAKLEDRSSRERPNAIMDSFSLGRNASGEGNGAAEVSGTRSPVLSTKIVGFQNLDVVQKNSEVANDAKTTDGRFDIDSDRRHELTTRKRALAPQSAPAAAPMPSPPAPAAPAEFRAVGYTADMVVREGTAQSAAPAGVVAGAGKLSFSQDERSQLMASPGAATAPTSLRVDSYAGEALSREEKTKEAVPVLGDVPMLGQSFSEKRLAGSDGLEAGKPGTKLSGALEKGRAEKTENARQTPLRVDRVAVPGPAPVMAEPPIVTTMSEPSAAHGAAGEGAEGINISDFNSAGAQSALTLKGVYAARGGGGRASALARYGGGASAAQSTEYAVKKSLDWLKSQQNDDGSWNHGGTGPTSLALLALLAHGETPASREYGDTLRKGLRYLMRKQDATGRFSAMPDEHALSTYAMSEAYSLTQIPFLKDAMEKAVGPLLENERTGRPENTQGPDWSARAIKAAQLAGSDNTALKPAVDTVVSRLKTDSNPASVLGLQLFGQWQEPEARQKMKQLGDASFNWNDGRSLQEELDIHEAKFNQGGKTWLDWNRRVIPTIVSAQNKDGSWPARTIPAGNTESPIATTAMASLMCEVYYRFLPTFQPVTIEKTPEEAPAEVDISLGAAKEPTETAKPQKPVFRAYGVNPYINASDSPFSTFSITVDTASYALSRNYMLNGSLPPPEAVRTEEFINFFDYAYPPPTADAFAIYADGAPNVFRSGMHLLKIGLKGQRLGRETKKPVVLTVVVDTSGSMNTADRIGLVKKALSMLVGRLAPADRVAIVQFESHARLVLEQTPASDTNRILSAINGLQTSGMTELEEGLKLGYEVAARGFRSGGANRVLLLSDGVANLGATAADDILKAVESYRRQGIYCSVFGFGMGTYDDTMLQTLASKGNGNYQFIDSVDEARRLFVEDLAGTLNVIAADAKIQVEFNPRRVKQYRQIGYESRQLRKEDFRNDAIDAGEIGSGQSVTALYDLQLEGDAREPIGTVRVRYRNTETGRIDEIQKAITADQLVDSFERADLHFRLAAGVAQFAEILRGSPYAEGCDFEEVAKVLRPVALELSLDQRVQELLRLVHSASGLSHAAP